MRVFVINQNKEPLNTCHPAKARLLLSSGRAAVWKRYPFTIILKQEVKNPVVKEHRLKIDPGSQVTGLAILEGNRVVFAAELTHRGLAIKATLESRRAIRRGRRNRQINATEVGNHIGELIQQVVEQLSSAVPN